MTVSYRAPQSGCAGMWNLVEALHQRGEIRMFRGLNLNGRVLITGLALVVIVTLIAASAQAKPKLVVLSVLAPHPPGTQPGGEMFLQATVKARGPGGRKAEVLFYLSN